MRLVIAIYINYEDNKVVEKSHSISIARVFKKLKFFLLFNA